MESIPTIYNIHFDENLNAVIMEWNGYANSMQFREGTELMLNTLIQNRTSKVIAQLRDMTLIGAEDQAWLEKQFLPRAIKFGFKSIAIVKPQSHFNKVAIESVTEKIDKTNLSVDFFDTFDEAIERLKKDIN
jgi:hypothetical protein